MVLVRFKLALPRVSLRDVHLKRKQNVRALAGI